MQGSTPIGHSKDYQFGATAMREHWRIGSLDAARALAHPDWRELPTGEATFVSHELPQAGPDRAG